MGQAVCCLPDEQVLAVKADVGGTGKNCELRSETTRASGEGDDWPDLEAEHRAQ